MADSEREENFSSTELAAGIVAAFVAHNSLPVAELPALIASVETALRGLAGHGPAVAETEKPTPAVPIRRSVTPDYLVCLDDGKQFKSLKRHLAVLGMTPEEYRAKWGLPADYPMVAQNYAAQRSDLAKSMGLGQARKTTAAKRGRKPKGSGQAAV
ncbi:MucR family transcriptional regulator [Methylocystis parvus]|uniref:MucR family transcriptional regulator n=1 Tax=Methylocystis parvus TaxID=134 RepID=A0A6B8MFS5_9HYPH|nr:MucR family transcriptional regulator [Methylocystis parvus]QGN00034.1 MucR family transcriptional regulator [Methylocystis parvus]WBK02468.1 MucR family transcriptional regulator [Methylocystis parvus OBBP]